MKERVRVRCVFAGHKSVKGFKGYWQSEYTFYDLETLKGERLVDEVTFKNLKSIKGKGYKRGDILEMDVTVERSDDVIKVSRPSNVVKVGKI